MADADDQQEDEGLKKSKLKKKRNGKTGSNKTYDSEEDCSNEEDGSDVVKDYSDEDELSEGEVESDDGEKVVKGLKNKKEHHASSEPQHKKEQPSNSETQQNLRRRERKQKTEEVKKVKPEHKKTEFKKKPERKHIIDDPPVPFAVKAVMFLIAMGIGWYFSINTLGSYIDKPDNHNYNRINVFDRKLKAMKKVFPTQNTLIWNMLKNGGRRHLKKIFSEDKKDLTPQSYLFAGYSGSSKTVQCFVSKLAEAFTVSPLKGKQVLDSKNFNDENGKENLLRTLNETLSGTEKLLVISDIDELPFSVAQLFMSYADEHNEVASFPQSMLFLTTDVPISFESEKNRVADEGKVGEHFKSKVWSGVHVDKTAPLWSRIGDGLVLIRKEAKNPCER